MCAGSPLPFQHPGPVGRSPAVLHLCSEDPGALGTYREEIVTLNVSGREVGRQGEVGQDGLIGGVGGGNQAPECCICQIIV